MDLEKSIIKKSLCFDIGANVGSWCLANIDYFDKIIAIEASHYIYTELCKKNSDKIITLNYAVCNNNCNDVKFYHCKTHHTLSTLNKDWFTNPKSRFYSERNNILEIICKTITIDKLIEIYGKPDFIKVDVECAEYECISSLNTKIDILCFEWTAEYNELSFKCLDYLENLGYTKFYIQDTDNYTFRPPENEFILSILDAKKILSTKIIKSDWGMLWCK
jgi:FkbM family methyltransferase